MGFNLRYIGHLQDNAKKEKAKREKEWKEQAAKRLQTYKQMSKTTVAAWEDFLDSFDEWQDEIQKEYEKEVKEPYFGKVRFYIKFRNIYLEERIVTSLDDEDEDLYGEFTHEDIKFTTVKIEVSSTIFGDRTLTVPLNIENYHFNEKDFNEYIVDECMEKLVKILRRNKLKAYYGKPDYDRDYEDAGKLKTLYTEHYITDLFIDI